jgi:integrase/recombinase XerD
MRENYLVKFEINLIKADKQQKEPYTEEEIKKPNLRECGFVEHRNWVLVNYLLEKGAIQSDKREFSQNLKGIH